MTDAGAVQLRAAYFTSPFSSAKVIALFMFFIWVRWMLPRFRYDQLMDLGWRRFVPFALANILFYALVLWARA